MIVMLALPLMLVIGAVLVALEHRFPAHPLEPARRWYVVALAMNALQLGVFWFVDHVWTTRFDAISLDLVGDRLPPLAAAFVAYFVFTFVIYGWHRARHASPWAWRVFHQLHHSPRRIQTLTAYYIHPLDMIVDVSISNAILFPLLGLGLEAAAWYTLITGVAGFVIHSNLRIPRWVGYVFQTPEMHRVHHKSGYHASNYSDIVLWDWLFGTYENPREPVTECGFDAAREARLFDMFLGRDLYRGPYAR